MGSGQIEGGCVGSKAGYSCDELWDFLDCRDGDGHGGRDHSFHLLPSCPRPSLVVVSLRLLKMLNTKAGAGDGALEVVSGVTLQTSIKRPMPGIPPL